MNIENNQTSAPEPAISAARLTAILGANKLKGKFSFDEIRAAEGKTREQLTDGQIHQSALNAGLKVTD